jgi:hypothetical protein
MDTNQSSVVIDFGTRKVRRHGDYTRVIALDKKALHACGCSDGMVIMAKIELVKQSDQSFLKVTPFCEKATQDENKENGDE